jgi:hypothetical protein
LDTTCVKEFNDELRGMQAQLLPTGWLSAVYFMGITGQLELCLFHIKRRESLKQG